MSDSTPALLAELAEALVPLGPQIAGLWTIETGTSPALSSVIVETAHKLVATQSAIEAVQTAIEALQAFGYPNVPTSIVLPSELWSELQMVLAARAAAMALFKVQP